jgi:RNA polymerase sigma factor (sigma-70 family)
VAAGMDGARPRRRRRGLPGAEEVARSYGGRLAAKAWRAFEQFGARPQVDQVQEVVQEAYCRLLDNGGRGLTACRARCEEQAIAYLYKVVENVVLDELRARGAAKRGGRLSVQTEDRVRLERRVADPRGTPEDRLLAAERRRRIWERWCEVGNRSGDDRNLRILRLALLEGWSSREIGRAHRLAPSSVDSVIHRLRRQLCEDGIALPRRAPGERTGGARKGHRLGSPGKKRRTATVELSPATLEHLRALTARQRATVLAEIEIQLRREPTVETRNRKPMRPNPLAPWELRIGDLRIYYDVEAGPEPRVLIRAIGVKERDRVRIGGKELKL